MVVCEVERAAIVSFSCKLVADCEEPFPGCLRLSAG
jgi:hypothetical protein